MLRILTGLKDLQINIDILTGKEFKTQILKLTENDLHNIIKESVQYIRIESIANILIPRLTKTEPQPLSSSRIF